MRISIALTLALVLGGGSAGFAQGLTDARISNSDMAFVQAAARINQIHAHMGKAAQERAVKAGVRDFAARMAADHQRLNKELLAITAEQGVIIPGVDQNTAIQALVEKKFADQQGEALDRQYLRLAVEDLRQMQTLLSGEAKAGEAGYLRNYAAKVLPTYQQHLKTALELAQESQEK